MAYPHKRKILLLVLLLNMNCRGFRIASDQGSVTTFSTQKCLHVRKRQITFLFHFNFINICSGLNYPHCSLNPQEEAVEKEIFVRKYPHAISQVLLLFFFLLLFPAEGQTFSPGTMSQGLFPNPYQLSLSFKQSISFPYSRAAV